MADSTAEGDGVGGGADVCFEDVLRDTLQSGGAWIAQTANCVTENGTAEYGPPVPHVFCKHLLEFLAGLAAVFDEREELRYFHAYVRDKVMGDADAELAAIQEWHHAMTTHADGTPRNPSLYDLTKLRDAEGVFSSDVWVFDATDARAWFYDPGFDDHSRETTWRHVDVLNSHALMMSLIPADMMEAIQAAASTINPDEPITLESATNLLQIVLGAGAGAGAGGDDGPADPHASDRIVGWAMHIMRNLTAENNPYTMSMFESVVGAKKILPALGLEGGSLESLGDMFRALQSEVDFNGALLRTGDGDDDDGDEYGEGEDGGGGDDGDGA
jgi:hypothetical protein